jgi:hypothetical protein
MCESLIWRRKQRYMRTHETRSIGFNWQPMPAVGTGDYFLGLIVGNAIARWSVQQKP